MNRQRNSIPDFEGASSPEPDRLANLSGQRFSDMPPPPPVPINSLNYTRQPITRRIPQE